MNGKKWLRLFVFVIGVLIILALLVWGNLRTERIYASPEDVINIDSLGDELYLLEPEWQIEIVGDQQVYTAEISISASQIYSGFYLPRASHVEFLVNHSSEKIFSDGRHLICLFEPMATDQTALIEIRLPLTPNEIISAPQLYFAKYDALMNAGYPEMNLRLFIVGLSFMIFLTSISLYFQKPTEKYLLPLALLAYATFGHILLRVSPALDDIIWIKFLLLGSFKLPFLSPEFNSLIYEMGFTFLITYLNYVIIKNFVSVKIFNIDYIYFILVGILGIILFVDEQHYATTPLIYHLFIGLLVTIVVIKGDYTQKAHRITLLLAATITMGLELFIAGCGEGIIPHGNVDLMYSLGAIPPASYAIIFTIAVTGIFSRKYAESDALSEELELLNNNLQIVVDERTSELQTAYQRLEEEQQQKDIFVTNMVHSLKTPLFSIAGFADMAHEAIESSPEKVDHFINLINTNADYVVKLVNNLFLALRLEYGKVSYMIETMNLGKMMEQIYNTSLTQTAQKDIQLTLEIPEQPLIIESDQNYLTLAIQNIADNAVRHTAGGGEIKLEVTDLGSEVHISIHDDGEGMSEEVVQRIFERYYSHSKRGNVSSGLGLSISKDVITALGGSITVDSVIGEGTQFNITLPKKKQDK